MALLTLLLAHKSPCCTHEAIDAMILVSRTDIAVKLIACCSTVIPKETFDLAIEMEQLDLTQLMTERNSLIMASAHFIDANRMQAKSQSKAKQIDE
eukprot:jgi/Hompol1/6268/HPOL_000319-RA